MFGRDRSVDQGRISSAREASVPPKSWHGTALPIRHRLARFRPMPAKQTRHRLHLKCSGLACCQYAMACLQVGAREAGRADAADSGRSGHDPLGERPTWACLLVAGLNAGGAWPAPRRGSQMELACSLYAAMPAEFSQMIHAGNPHDAAAESWVEGLAPSAAEKHAEENLAPTRQGRMQGMPPCDGLRKRETSQDRPASPRMGRSCMRWHESGHIPMR
jgi:hypothetical protein